VAADPFAQQMQQMQPMQGSAGKGGRPVAGVDGNWQCGQCQNVNFATRDACNRCATPRAQAEVAADPFAQQMQQMQPMQGSAGKGGRPVAGVDGNWACPGCQNVNFAQRTACNRCQTPKPADEESFQWGGLAGGALGIQAAGAGAKGGGRGGPPMAGVDGNWACPGCQNVNFATRMACNRCQMPKPEDQFGGGGFGGFGGKAGGKGKAPVAGENGNWGCPGCGNVNFASRDVCNRCQAPKPEEDATAFASFGAADGGFFDQLLQAGDYADGQPAKRMKF